MSSLEGKMQHMSEEETGGSLGCSRGTHQGLWVLQVQGTSEHVPAVSVPGGWCPAGQQIACLRGAEVKW